MTAKKYIYFDHSATTPLDREVLKAMAPFWQADFGNPASLHLRGRQALEAVDIARERIAEFFNCQPGEIIFTSGATEANNLAIKGLVKNLRAQGWADPEIITSAIEHDSILEPIRELEKEGVNAVFAPVNGNGIVDPAAIRAAINERTVLVSVMYVNSETGALQPVREIGKLVRKAREKRHKLWLTRPLADREKKERPLWFHTDATQAVNFFNCGAQGNFFDLLSFSGHKIYGPKGVGVLYKNAKVGLSAIQTGGHQEGNLRSGTLNVPGIVGLGAAIRLLGQAGKMGEPSREQKKNTLSVAKLRDLLVKGVLKSIPNVILNTPLSQAAPGHAHFSFLGVEGESTLIALDLAGIGVSTGSACASGSLTASHVLLAMGIKTEVAHNSVRFTIGKLNTREEINKVLQVLPPIISRLRRMSPIKE